MRWIFMKKTLILALIVCLLTSMSMAVFAASEPPYEYEITDGKATITGLSDYQLMGNFVIKNKFENCPVATIASRSFANVDTMEGVVVPDTVVSIGSSAFDNCVLIEKVDFPDSLRSIGNAVLNGTAYYKNESNWINSALYAGKHFIKMKTSFSGDYEIKPGTITIADSSFERCSKLSSVKLPDSLKAIGNNAFWNCKNLTSISIPKSVEIIGDGAFKSTNITVINYDGSEDDWNKIEFGVLNEVIENATINFAENSPPAPEVPIDPNVITVKVNNVAVKFDQTPIIENGRTLVPLRAIFEALGAEVGWDGATQTVTASKADIQISLQIGSNKMHVNDDIKTLDVPAQLINSRTLVPVRAISEAFGCKVDWDGTTRTVIITQ